MVVERERVEDNDGDDDFDNDDISKAEAVVKTTMATTSDAHVGGGTSNVVTTHGGDRDSRVVATQRLFFVSARTSVKKHGHHMILR